MPKSKKNIKVRDLKPTKDAKGGGNPYGKPFQGTGKGETGTPVGGAGKGETGTPIGGGTPIG